MVKYNNLKILDANSVGSKSLTSTMRTTNSGGEKNLWGQYDMVSTTRQVLDTNFRPFRPLQPNFM